MPENNKTLFNKTFIDNLSIKNRFVRSATWEGLADENGNVTVKLINYYRNLSLNNIGIIITSHCYVSKDGTASPFQIGAYSRKQLYGLKKLANVIKKNGSAAIMQINHGGCHALGNPQKFITNGFDVKTIIKSFLKAAVLAEDAGYDGVQIHAAHGYLLSQFLSNHYNRRTDDYGVQNYKNRTRLIINIIDEIKNKKPDFPVFIKINILENIAQSLSENEILEVIKEIEKAGVSCFEFSGGTQLANYISPVPKGDLKNEHDEGYYKDLSCYIKKNINKPVMLVGGIRSLNKANELIVNNYTDYISLSRPLIAEPNLVDRWQKGYRLRSKCISCNQCFKPANAGKGIRCILNP